MRSPSFLCTEIVITWKLAYRMPHGMYKCNKNYFCNHNILETEIKEYEVWGHPLLHSETESSSKDKF